MEIAIVIGLLLAAVILFATEKISVDVVTLGLLCVLVLSGIISVQEAFAGFGNEVIVMLASIFVIGAALRETGVLDALGNLLARRLKGPRSAIIAGVMTGVAGVSAFMNNTTVTAMFLGPTIGLARRLNLTPSCLLMPLAFASILGGTCTLIGTSTNVAVSSALVGLGYAPIKMFELTPLGLIIVFVGVVYMVFVGIRLIPTHRAADSVDDAISLREYLAEVVILPGSPLIGQRPFSSDFSILEFQVVKVRRDNAEVPWMESVTLQQGDVVLVAGKVRNLMKIKKIEGLDIKDDVSLKRSGIDTDQFSIAEVVLTSRCNLVGTTLRRGNFRRRSGLSVLALLRGDRSLGEKMADVVLQAGDLLLIQGPYDRLRSFEENGEMVVIVEHQFTPVARKRGFALLIAFFVAILASSLGWVPASIAFLITAMVALATRSISLETAYDNIDWRLLILIGGMTAFGAAMSSSGADKWLAALITGGLEPMGPGVVLAGFCLLTVVLTQPMSNAAAALVVLPIALQSAAALGVNPRTFGIAVMLSASVSVLTPFEPSCVLVYGPGKYRVSDFIKVGGGLTLVATLIIILLVPIFWPLH